MATTYGFFNSVSGDRTYNADQMSEMFKGLITDGVYEAVGGALQVKAGSGMSVNVSSGRMLIDSRWLDNDAMLNVPISQAHPTLARYTSIIARLDRANRLIEITTKDSEAASSPTYPAIVNDGNITEKCLAIVLVQAGATSISQSNIQDTRGDNTWCGWVKLSPRPYIARFFKRVTLDGNTTTIALDMEGYTYDPSDILFVHVNGLLASEAVDYIIDATSNPAILHPPTSVKGNVVEITVLKSEFGLNNGDERSY